jgi:hypothetical protein
MSKYDVGSGDDPGYINLKPASSPSGCHRFTGILGEPLPVWGNKNDARKRIG